MNACILALAYPLRNALRREDSFVKLSNIRVILQSFPDDLSESGGLNLHRIVRVNIELKISPMLMNNHDCLAQKLNRKSCAATADTNKTCACVSTSRGGFL